MSLALTDVKSLLPASRDPGSRLGDLDDVWHHLSDYPALATVATVGPGASLRAGKQVTVDKRAFRRRPADAVPAIATQYRESEIWQVPTPTWLYSDRRDVLHWRGGAFLGRPQVLLSYASQVRQAWRLTGFYDLHGHAVTNKYATVRPDESGPSVLAIWALINSPVANAFVHCGSRKRHTLDGLLKTMPIPRVAVERWGGVEATAAAYLATAKASGSTSAQPGVCNVLKTALLAVDSEVLRLYDLPPRLERQLLDLFTGVERPGVGCDFRGYYPPGFTSCLPLHMIISDDFQRAAVNATADRFRPGESAYVREVLRAAAAGAEE